MEKFFTNKSIWKKIVVAVLIVMAFQFIVSTPIVRADGDYKYEEGDALGWGGVLLKPLMSLIVTLGDGVMDIMHSAVMGVESPLLHVDLNNDWIELLVKVIIVAVAAVATVLTLGVSTVVTGLIIAGVAGMLFGVNVVPIAANGIENAATAVCSTIYADHTPGDLYLPAYTFTPEEIFKGRILLFNVNFFQNSTDKIRVAYHINEISTSNTQTTATGGQMRDGTKTVEMEGKKDLDGTIEDYHAEVAKEANKQGGGHPEAYQIDYYYYEDSNR